MKFECNDCEYAKCILNPQDENAIRPIICPYSGTECNWKVGK